MPVLSVPPGSRLNPIVLAAIYVRLAIIPTQAASVFPVNWALTSRIMHANPVHWARMPLPQPPRHVANAQQERMLQPRIPSPVRPVLPIPIPLWVQPSAHRVQKGVQHRLVQPAVHRVRTERFLRLVAHASNVMPALMQTTNIPSVMLVRLAPILRLVQPNVRHVPWVLSRQRAQPNVRHAMKDNTNSYI